MLLFITLAIIFSQAAYRKFSNSATFQPLGLQPQKPQTTNKRNGPSQSQSPSQAGQKKRNHITCLTSSMILWLGDETTPHTANT